MASIMIPKTGQIPCRLSNGMFQNEYAVEIVLSGGMTASFFADKELIVINGSEESGYITVEVIDDPAEGDPTVLLPKEVFEQGTRWVKIPKAQVVRA